MSNLKEAISYIYDVEKNNYFMTRAIFNVTQEIQKPRLKKEPYVNIRRMPQEPVAPSMPSKPKKPEYENKWSFKDWCVLVIISAVISCILIVNISYIIDFSNEMFLCLLLGCFCVCMLVGRIWIQRDDRLKYKTLYKDYQNEMREYEEILYPEYDKARKTYETDHLKYKIAIADYRKEYNKRYDEAKKADEEKFKARQDALNYLLMQLTNKLAQSVTLLAKMYDAVGIDDDYRNIVPIAYMDKFVRLGIATKLEGADGLYYLIRKELQFEQMNQKLDVIIDKLDSIIDKQHDLYSELVALNSKCDNMISSSIRQTNAILAQNKAIYQQNNLISNQNALMEKIQSDTQIAAYNSDRMAREQEYMNYFQRYDRW